MSTRAAEVATTGVWFCSLSDQNHGFNPDDHNTGLMTRASERIASSSAAKKQKPDEVPLPVDDVLAPDPTPKSQNKRKQAVSKQAADVPPVTELTRIAKARLHLQDVLLQEISRNDVSEDNSDGREDCMSPPQKTKKQRSSRKGRRSDVREDGLLKQPALLLKLCDRSVDLGKFIAGVRDEDIPLYPICREWMRNGREATELSHLSESRLDTDKKPGIQRLPNPIPLSAEQRARGLDPRIPKNVTKPTTTADQIDSEINSVGMEGADVSQLLQQSVQRWRRIRADWRQAGRENELRYKHSCDVLKSMFDKSTSAQSADLLEPKIEPIDSSY